jgi:hypothetical protein
MPIARSLSPNGHDDVLATARQTFAQLRRPVVETEDREGTSEKICPASETRREQKP